MERIVINEYNIKDEDINEIETRVKAILINKKDEVLLGYAKNKYQFIGGHVEEKETLVETAEREILEETGIELSIDKSLKPVAKYECYWKDEPKVNQNKKLEIYYYILKCDKKVNYDKTNYTEEEKKNNFELRYIPISNLENEIIDNCNKYESAKGIAEEMLEVVKRVEIKV